MKASEIRELEPEELLKKEGELSQELFNLKYQLHTGQIENTARISEVRKDVARVQTVLAEKQQ